MPPSRPFSETIREQFDKDAAFKREFLRSAVESSIEGDLLTAKAAMREYINATIGFIELGKALGRSPKSLMRMLSASGNPQLKNFFEMTSYLQRHAGVRAEIHLHDVGRMKKAA